MVGRIRRLRCDDSSRPNLPSARSRVAIIKYFRSQLLHCRTEISDIGEAGLDDVSRSLIRLVDQLVCVLLHETTPHSRHIVAFDLIQHRLALSIDEKRFEYCFSSSFTME
jgi:hypothetical protein